MNKDRTTFVSICVIKQKYSNILLFYLKNVTSQKLSFSEKEKNIFQLDRKFLTNQIISTKKMFLI